GAAAWSHRSSSSLDWPVAIDGTSPTTDLATRPGTLQRKSPSGFATIQKCKLNRCLCGTDGRAIDSVVGVGRESSGDSGPSQLLATPDDRECGRASGRIDQVPRKPQMVFRAAPSPDVAARLRSEDTEAIWCEASDVPSLGDSCTSRQHPGDGGG